MSLPNVTLEGGLISQPDVKFSQGGKSFTVGRVACTDRKRDQQTGGWVDGDTTFLDFIIFGEQGERFAESVGKGDQVVLTGALQQREYEKDGVKHTTYSIRVDSAAVSVRFRVAKAEPKPETAGTSGGWS